jgi:hypothetical protein
MAGKIMPEMNHEVEEENQKSQGGLKRCESSAIGRSG